MALGDWAHKHQTHTTSSQCPICLAHMSRQALYKPSIAGLLLVDMERLVMFLTCNTTQVVISDEPLTWHVLHI